METYTYFPKGVCSKVIELKIENDIILDISFQGGCNGNLKGISALCRGQKAQDVIERLKGIKCGMKSTSCPDQLASCLEQYVSQNKTALNSTNV